MKSPNLKLQRYLVYLLRHNPADLEIELGKNGFVEIEALVAALRKRNRYSWVKKENIYDVVDSQPDKQRLEIQGSKIRAAYGHSKNTVEAVEYVAVTPPQYLFHGTPVTNIDAIRNDGLLPISRQYVHMSDFENQARKVALRYSQHIVIIVILSEEAHKEGIEFYHPEPLIWLAEEIPPRFLKISE